MGDLSTYHETKKDEDSQAWKYQHKAIKGDDLNYVMEEYNKKLKSKHIKIACAQTLIKTRTGLGNAILRNMKKEPFTSILIESH